MRHQGATICGVPDPKSGGLFLCSYPPGHDDGHSWQRALALPADTGPAVTDVTPAHACLWEYQADKQLGREGNLINPPRTILLMRCSMCGVIVDQILTGHWTRQELGL